MVVVKMILMVKVRSSISVSRLEWPIYWVPGLRSKVASSMIMSW